MISDQLEKFGLSMKEAQIFFSLLQLGSSPVSDIARDAKINRSTAYVLLTSLASKGLVSISTKVGIRLYTACPPERLLKILEDSIDKYKNLLSNAERLLPELKLMYNGSGPRPKVQFLEGVEGIKTAYEDTLTSKETIRAIASIEDMHKVIPDYFPEYYHRRSKKNIYIKAIFPDTEASRERVTRNKIEKREAYLIPSEKYKFSPEINIYDNKVVFMSLVEKFALVLESKELSDALKKMFELAWAEASRLHYKNHGN